jgi:hypothetical protein
MDRTLVKAVCAANHEWNAAHELQGDGHTRLVVPLYCPKCERPATKTLPRERTLNP